VQQALDVASKSRTTVCIAHRLSTIKNADNIIVVSLGEIVEQGTHDELIARGGVYKGLVEAQRISTERTGAIEKEIAAGNAEEEAIDELVRVTSLQSSTDEVPLARAKTLRSVTSDEAVNSFISAGIVPVTNYGNVNLFRKVSLFSRPS
jgi:ATP-binding cassette, subfamily B (MDR/TAP), member 1